MKLLCALLLMATAQSGSAQNAAPPSVATQSVAPGTAQAAPQQPAPLQSVTPPAAAQQPGTTTATATAQPAPPPIQTDPCIAQAEFCALVNTGQLADLRWPNFANYRKEVKDFYQAGGYSLAWIAITTTTAPTQNQPTPQALAMIAALQAADKKGLSAEDYDGLRWNERLARLAQPIPAASASDWMRFDLALTVSAMRYISDLHNGRISPQYFDYGLDVEPKKYKLAEFLRTRVVAAQDVAVVLQEVEPSHAAYRRAMAALAQYVALAKAGGEGDPLPIPADKVKPGDVYPALPQLAQRLRLLGDLPAEVQVTAATQSLVATPVAATPTLSATPTTGTTAATQTPAAPPKNVYEGELVNAVKRFQQRHGLLADGTIGKDTFLQLNVPLSHRVVQLQLALERWRWLPGDLHAPMIVVNIPEFTLHGYADDDDHQTLTMKTVVGKAPDHQTPVFTETMKFLIFRPYWNVPKSIIEKELLPAITKSTAYLDKHNYEVLDKSGEVIPTDKVDADVLRQLKAKHLEIRQRPGPANSLGTVKFLFPNEYDVYMHGTPEHKLFARAKRDFSHGCVRVEDPASLAAWVLNGNPRWTPQRIRGAMNGKEPMQVNLPREIPVFILYGTAWVEENGEVHFFGDVYGHDAQMESALAKGQPYPVKNPTPNPTVFISRY
jgi:murein L,D-transpeptidase YcbB/YkuD